MTDDINLWTEAGHAERYLQIAYRIPRREEGEAALLECIPARTRRVLDLGSGEGRLIGLVLDYLPEATGVAVDFSDTMLARLDARFGSDPRVEVRRHDLDTPLPDLGTFDAIVSSFAIHHVPDARKQALYAEIHDRLVPGGVFLNLEHVASATPAMHAWFLHALGVTPAQDDPSNKLAPVEMQLQWLRAIGFIEVDCHWKWRELALLAGVKAD
ncbi:methyltransferase [Luteitalea sp. TBR-22]|uniref:class I SAM-dependent methyltransferase n=1 Tax=Luteitalea sp. TBR-22 TaxID=2802971 RepID=UPI001AF22AC5|nr:class I SAM-dependent methyltransferase [Luteitalea sp. TBR-22]BCS32142.1 methyltransferase [Luteitalea sp. TBR-22]